ncbi:hypothetical protein N1851_025823 [Merluccius polli]|uniref:Uncharacterized protein n=1 Tax=Merluccius polli TaxID=89951 RepID=A0AA47NVT6_MERPO|nr:hypothetical protein N1851_025823 [Merluccius polli]
MFKVSEPRSTRQQWQLAFISEFTMDIQHVAGRSNVVADCLSRAIIDTVHMGIDYAQMAVDQVSDPGIQAYRTAIISLQLADIKFDDTSLLCDVSAGQRRPIVPEGW